MAIPSKNVLGNPNVTEGNFQIAIEQLRESVIGSGKTYDSANTYMAYDICYYSGVVYYSKINNNIGNTPSIGANWGDYTDLLLGVVHKTGNETIAGVKTFSSGINLQNQNVSPYSGFKNYIINGKKIINQRELLTTDNSYNQDRWYKAGNNWYQGIEGVNLINGKKYTLSWEGTATASYHIGGATSATINAQSFTTIANGGNFTLTIGAEQKLWIKFASDSTGSTFNFVQLEEGSVATPFENRPYGLELSLCQRYYEKVDAYRCNIPVYGTGTGFLGSVKYKVPKITVPTVSLGTASHWRTLVINSGVALSTLNILENTSYGFDVNGTSSGGNITEGYAGKIQVGDGYTDNGTDGIFVSAEL